MFLLSFFCCSEAAYSSISPVVPRAFTLDSIYMLVRLPCAHQTQRIPPMRTLHSVVSLHCSSPNLTRLPGTTEEMKKVRQHFLGDQVIHLDDTYATVDAVLSTMDVHRCQTVHLACHGLQHLMNPMKCAFALYDGPLHLSKLMSRPRDNAELAFLSACQTATSDAKVPEKAVHPAAGMLSAGYKAVIGTMWSIGDQDAPLVADEVYRRLRQSLEKTDDRGGG
jgi:CHAT domain-containing protein